MRYIAIERSVEQRSQHPEEVLSLDALTPEVVGEGLVGVVLANELLDNLAFTPIVRTLQGLQRLDVVVEGSRLVTAPGQELSPDEAALFGDAVGEGVLQSAAAEWLADLLEVITAGRVVVIDYARLESELVEVRTYAGHGRAGDPLVALGTKDITVDVDLAQLQRAVRPATTVQTQADWLDSLGMAGSWRPNGCFHSRPRSIAVRYLVWRWEIGAVVSRRDARN